MGVFNWEDLSLPEYEEPEVTVRRLDDLHASILLSKGVSTKPEKNSPGFNPTTAQAREVAVMSCLGMDAKDIALVINVEEKLLKMYYAKELKVSANIANAMVARQALNMAMSGRYPDMTKFWLKSRAKWKETNSMEISGPDGGAMEFSSAKEKFAAVMATAAGKAGSK